MTRASRVALPALMSRVASMPSSTGIVMSITMTAGCHSYAAIRASKPFSAVLDKEATLKQRFGDKHAGILDIVDHQHGRDWMGVGVGPFGRLRLQPSQKRLRHFLHLAATV